MHQEIHNFIMQVNDQINYYSIKSLYYLIQIYSINQWIKRKKLMKIIRFFITLFNQSINNKLINELITNKKLNMTVVKLFIKQ